MADEYDVIVIGGGIAGAAAAAALTRRGYRLLLLDQQDFAAGATAASPRLIVGGLLDLQRRDLRSLHRHLRAREGLLRQRPHLAQPLPLLLPWYAAARRRRLRLRAALLTFDSLTPRKVAPAHQRLSRTQTQRVEPALQSLGLRAADRYYEALATHPERLCLEFLAAAREAGADLRNYAAVDAVLVTDGVAHAVDYHDVLTGVRHHATARALINATGPWLDTVLESTGQHLRPLTQPVREALLVLDLDGRLPRHAIRLPSADGPDVLAVPWQNHLVISGTRVPYPGDPAAARPDAWEIDHLLAQAARALPGIGIDRAHLAYALAAVVARPLRGNAAGRVINHRADGVERLFSVVGAELGTAAALGDAIARQVRRAIGAPPRSGRPRPLPPRAPGRVPFLPPDVGDHLRARYGPRAPDVAAYVALDPALSEPLSPAHPDIGAQVVYAVEQEGARLIGDVLFRRTLVGLTQDLGRAALPRVATLMAQRLGWTEAQRAGAMLAYDRDLEARVRVATSGPTTPPTATRRRALG